LLLSLQTDDSDGFAIKILKGRFMNKSFDEIGVFTLTNSDSPLDKEAVKAQEQWEKDGTVSAEYLHHVLGDISVGVSAFIPSDEKEEPKLKEPHKS